MGKGQVGPPRELYYPRFPVPQARATRRSFWDEVGIPREVGVKALIMTGCLTLGGVLILGLLLLAAFGVIHPLVRP